MEKIINHTKEFWEKKNIHSKTKLCVKCGLEKERDRFTTDKRHVDGKGSYCFECRRDLFKKMYNDNPERIKKTNKKWVDKNIDKRKAHEALRRAIATGKIIKPDSCSICGSAGRIEGHHWHGYSKENRLDVKWLCHPCHEKYIV